MSDSDYRSTRVPLLRGEGDLSLRCVDVDGELIEEVAPEQTVARPVDAMGGHREPPDGGAGDVERADGDELHLLRTADAAHRRRPDGARQRYAGRRQHARVD